MYQLSKVMAAKNFVTQNLTPLHSNTPLHNSAPRLHSIEYTVPYGPRREKTFGVSVKARFKPVSTATENLEN